ncbi:hypothetical protein B0T17DRAFT_489002 [Bombardia bombarda]|uniref:Atos-like conserved domain-containing protein n=1 Tax=Bombardia bombarda TaxID=252184 RepID=A0AA39X9T1_9PEZI|nr:hypothetical protein B0T17DRAFT_489002 [Bombardia bombarda]
MRSTGRPTSPLPLQNPVDIHRPLSRRVSEESIRTELCEGPVPDSPPPHPPKSATPEQLLSNLVSDRTELIERLKRGESPTWVPNRHVRCCSCHPQATICLSIIQLESLFQQTKTQSPPRTPQLPTATTPGLLPPPTITPEKQDGRGEREPPDTQLEQGLNIERPRSALHSGNFTPEELTPHAATLHSHHFGPQGEDNKFRPASTPWLASSPPRDFPPFDFSQGAAGYKRDTFHSGISSISSSLSSSFVYKPPTSPLVQSLSNEDIDIVLPLDNIDIATSGSHNARRHSLNFTQSSPYTNVASLRHAPPPRREGPYPYQAHQPRRSLTVTPSLFVGSSPQSSSPAYLRQRRPSFSSEASPIQHASMVGSYEESILRGRMSTTPSKPLDFMAQIGVLGLGNCKPSLRCPSHITLPFSAVFYSYASTSHGRSKADDGPSPYVGQIDLENGLGTPEEGQRAKRKLQTRYPERRPVDEDAACIDNNNNNNTSEMSDGDVRRPPTKPKRRSRSPKAPPGGRYRIPEKGQLQIIIKNQNKTAVKLFLIPYDLAGMEPSTKTFVRQRSYSAGPIIDNIPEIKDTTGLGSGGDRPILRYLVHLHICCPSRGRFYLYKSIRVVFANRVPDGKEKLRNEITYPEPRFSPYKPMRVLHTGGGGVGGPATLAAEQAFRRRSSGFTFAHYPPAFDGLSAAAVPSLAPPVAAAAVSLQQTTTTLSLAVSGGDDAVPGEGVIMGQQQQQQQQFRQVNEWEKLSRDDVGYGGNTFSPPAINGGGSGVPEGLLSQRLRSLGMQGYLSDDSSSSPRQEE